MTSGWLSRRGSLLAAELRFPLAGIGVHGTLAHREWWPVRWDSRPFEYDRRVPAPWREMPWCMQRSTLVSRRRRPRPSNQTAPLLVYSTQAVGQRGVCRRRRHRWRLGAVVRRGRDHTCEGDLHAEVLRWLEVGAVAGPCAVRVPQRDDQCRQFDRGSIRKRPDVFEGGAFRLVLHRCTPCRADAEHGFRFASCRQHAFVETSPFWGARPSNANMAKHSVD